MSKRPVPSPAPTTEARRVRLSRQAWRYVDDHIAGCPGCSVHRFFEELISGLEVGDALTADDLDLRAATEKIDQALAAYLGETPGSATC